MAGELLGIGEKELSRIALKERAFPFWNNVEKFWYRSEAYLGNFFQRQYLVGMRNILFLAQDLSLPTPLETSLADEVFDFTPFGAMRRDMYRGTYVSCVTADGVLIRLLTHDPNFGFSMSPYIVNVEAVGEGIVGEKVEDGFVRFQHQGVSRSGFLLPREKTLMEDLHLTFWQKTHD